MTRVLHIVLTALPLLLGWICGTVTKITILIQAAFAEGFEAGRKM